MVVVVVAVVTYGVGSLRFFRAFVAVVRRYIPGAWYRAFAKDSAFLGALKVRNSCSLVLIICL